MHVFMSVVMTLLQGLVERQRSSTPSPASRRWVKSSSSTTRAGDSQAGKHALG